MTPRILIIAGSDSGGGAGIQADIKTVTMLGGHAMTAITAITAQNTLGVQRVMPVPAEMVLDQMMSVIEDIGADAVKIGMIGSVEVAETVADYLGWQQIPIVFDPVMVATSGAVLSDKPTIDAMQRLARQALVVTPNLPEFAALCGRETIADEIVEEEAAVYAATIGGAVLVKGGHGSGELIFDRLIEADGSATQWRTTRIDSTNTHGTGCTLASAIATNLVYGLPLKAAIVRARRFVRLAIRDAPRLGGGAGPMGQQSVRLDLGPGTRLNQVTLPLADCRQSCTFYKAIGLKQIVGTDDGHYARFEAAGGATLSIEAGACPTMFFECDDLDAEVRRLQSTGMTFDSLPTDQPWLWREARLTDPSGNAICLYQAGENRRFPPWRLPDAWPQA